MCKKSAGRRRGCGCDGDLRAKNHNEEGLDCTAPFFLGFSASTGSDFDDVATAADDAAAAAAADGWSRWGEEPLGIAAMRPSTAG